MQNPYSKFIFALKTLIFDRFSKFLQALLRQIETQMLNKKHFSCPPAIGNYRQKSLSEGSFYTKAVFVGFLQVFEGTCSPTRYNTATLYQFTPRSCSVHCSKFNKSSVYAKKRIYKNTETDTIRTKSCLRNPK